MSRPRPPHLHRQTTRHGKTVWYVRKGKGPRIRIKAAFGTPEFDEAYQAAITTRDGGQKPARKASKGSLEWLWNLYRQTSSWADLSSATRRQRENIMRRVLLAAGHEPAAEVGRSDIVAGRDSRSKTPAQARNFLDAMRGLFRWAAEAEHIKSDPTASVKNPVRPKTGGFQVWTDDEVERYERRWPIGTKERVWFAVLLYTGLRRGDAVTVGRQHVRDGIATLLLTEKTGVTVTIPILPELDRILKSGPCGDLAFICGDKGTPLTKESFGNYFRQACNQAGVKKSAHGVRKNSATLAANNGATVAELEALFGWEGGGMAALYTRSADRARLSKGAISKLNRMTKDEISERENGLNIVPIKGDPASEEEEQK